MNIEYKKGSGSSPVKRVRRERLSSELKLFRKLYRNYSKAPLNIERVKHGFSLLKIYEVSTLKFDQFPGIIFKVIGP